LDTTVTIRDKQIRWGIIGVGDVCEKKSAPAMQLIPGSSIAAVMRRQADKAADYARRHGIGKWYIDAARLVHDPEVNAIYIATPPSSHLLYVEMAAAAGKPVYVEKPMALNYAECRQMIQVCEKMEVPLYVAYYRRALPNFLKVKEIVQSGQLGAIRFVEIRLLQAARPEVESQPDFWRVDPAISGGGHFVDLASHQFDFLDFVFGPVLRAKGFAKNQAGYYPAEDIVTAGFEFEHDIVGYGIWCFTVPKQVEEEIITITGSLGKLRFPCFGEAWISLEITGETPVLIKYQYPEHIQQPLINTIVQDLMGTGQCPSTGYTAARTNRVIDQILQERP
jgi:predicted dehydrogenase